MLRAGATDVDAIVPAVEATDAVVSALGPRRGDRAGICSAGVGAQLAAMAKTGVRRLAVVSAAGAYRSATDGMVTRTVVKPLLGRLLAEGFADVRAMDGEVGASGLDWTIVRPPRLLDRPYTGRYRTSLDRGVRRGYQIGRADVADAIRAAPGDPATVGHVLWVAS